MSELIPFTSNVTDCSTYDGYQFEFHCQRCGNGFRSRFRHSVTGFGGRLAALGGSILGGELGSRVEEVGMMAQWNRGGTRGSTNDQRMREASQDVAGEFLQCAGCTDWVCRHGCWDSRADRCRNCVAAMAPPVPQPLPAGQPAPSGPPVDLVGQLGQIGQIPVVGQFLAGLGQGQAPPQPPPAPAAPPAAPPAGTRFCGNCGAEGSGRFCGQCGTSFEAPSCRGCGAPQRGTAFCQNCGTPAR